MRTGDGMRRDWRPLSSVETISVSLTVQWPYPSFWPPGSRALHDIQSCNGYCLHLTPSSSDSMEPNLTESLSTSGICWCHTKERRCCFGFIDGTVRPICRPQENQGIVYNGHKRVHALKYQSVALPCGMIANMYGPVGNKNYFFQLIFMSCYIHLSHRKFKQRDCSESRSIVEHIKYYK